MKAIILAAGIGERMRPLTNNLPKPMLPIDGKPILEYTLKLLKKHGIEEVKITIEGSSNDLVKNAGFNIKLFERIKTQQDLPDWVVYDLIESSGKLKGTHFDRQLKNAD